MGRSTSTLILLVIALGFGGYLYFVDSKRPLEDETAKKKVFAAEPDKVNQLQVKSSTGEVTTLRKGADGAWTITAPSQAPADRTAAGDIATSLANLEEDRVVDEAATDLKTYGLAPPQVEVTFHVEGEEEPKQLLVGDKNPSGLGLYAKLPGNNRVFLVTTGLETTIDKSSFDLRDKTVLAFEQPKVTSIELVSSGQTTRVEKAGDEWKLVKPVQAPADFVGVSGLLGQLQSAQMTALKDRPEDLKDLRQYGLDRPAAVAIIGTGDSSLRLELGGTADEGSVWARDPSKAAVFSVNTSIADELKKTPADLRRKEVFDFRSHNVTRFEITRGKNTRAFERVKGTGENAVDTWNQVVPDVKTADSSNLEGALLEFSNLRAESFVDRAGAATGHSNPAAVISVKFDDGKKEERVTFGLSGGDAFAVRPDQPGALKLEAGKFEEALKKLDAVQ
jgi:hypothetical protein